MITYYLRFWILICCGLGLSLQVGAVSLDHCQTKMLHLSAYYSPEKGQAFYIHGSYEAEIKMNGKGTHGASGKPVYDGMLAGSSQYPFGTLVVIPKIGKGTIEDRGGVIISDPGGSGSNTESIDVRVGKGTAGLMRALTFGRQQRKGYICPGQKSTDIGFQIHTLPSYKYFFDVTVRVQRMSAGRKDQRVEALQKYLRKLGYLRQENIHGNYNSTTQEAVCKFQVKQKILTAEDPLCGTFGPKTSFAIKKEAQVRGLLPDDLYTLTTLEPIIAHLPDVIVSVAPSPQTLTGSVATGSKKESDEIVVIPSAIKTLSKLKGVKHKFYRYYKAGESNTEIIFLQQFLKQNGYYHGPITAINSSATKDALYQFQLAFGVLTIDTDPQLRGFLGPKTRNLINQTLVK